MEHQELIFQLSDADEEVIRTYECTRFRRWFSPTTTGYLTVTNKRVVFHSTGKSLTGKSLLITEMPLEDVSGLSMYDGLQINWLLFAIMAVLTFFATEILYEILPRFFTSYFFAAVLMLPYGLAWLLSSNILNDEARETFFQNVENLGAGRFKVKRDLKDYLPLLSLPLYVGLALFAWRVAFTSELALSTPFVGWLLLLLVYGFIYMNWFGRRHTFSLQIGSRTMKGSGIFLPGDALNLLSTRDTTALQALGAGPAGDSGKVIRELGALILDIQQLGDFGIQKWRI